MFSSFKSIIKVGPKGLDCFSSSTRSSYLKSGIIYNSHSRSIGYHKISSLIERYKEDDLLIVCGMDLYRPTELIIHQSKSKNKGEFGGLARLYLLLHGNAYYGHCNVYLSGTTRIIINEKSEWFLVSRPLLLSLYNDIIDKI